VYDGPEVPIRVRVEGGSEVPRELELHGEALTIGRARGSDVPLADAAASRRHARLIRRGGRWWVEDLGSRNGTRVDGIPVTAPAPVDPGSVIEVGAARIRVLECDGRVAERQSAPSMLLPVGELLDPTRAAAGETDRVARLAARLELLNEVHRDLARRVSREELLETILDRVFRHLRPEEAAIHLRGEGGEVRCVARRTTAEEPGAVLSQSLTREVVEKGMAALVLDLEEDDRFADARSLMASGVRSLAAAPLADPDGALGMIVVASRLHVRRFTEDDVELLASLASAAALRLRNLDLAEEAAERRRLEEELELARRIQRALLPEEAPPVEGWEAWGRTVPSRGVSGDLFTFRRLDDGRLATLVADVSGKGMAASLLTASLEALTAGPITSGSPPGRVLELASALLHERTPPERFATAFLAVVAPGGGSVVWASAGHVPALAVRRDGSVERLEATGIPLGLMPSARYGEGRVELAPGELLAAFTDGITEATPPGGEEFGLERVERELSAAREAALPELAGRLEAALAAHAGAGAAEDDRTLVLLRRLG